MSQRIPASGAASARRGTHGCFTGGLTHRRSPENTVAPPNPNVAAEDTGQEAELLLHVFVFHLQEQYTFSGLELLGPVFRRLAFHGSETDRQFPVFQLVDSKLQTVLFPNRRIAYREVNRLRRLGRIDAEGIIRLVFLPSFRDRPRWLGPSP